MTAPDHGSGAQGFWLRILSSFSFSFFPFNVMTTIFLFFQNEFVDLVRAWGHRVLVTVLFYRMHLFGADLNFLSSSEERAPGLPEGLEEM